jgi:hypothetical protein
METMARIRENLAAIPEGEPVVSSAFLRYGSRAAVDQALSRLTREGLLSRVARGVYVRPKSNEFVGEVPPEPFRVAQAIAKAAGTIVEWHGAEAARRLGLTTQMPTKPVFLTTGTPRRLRLGSIQIELRRAAPRKLYFAGRPAGEALSALWYLGRKGVTPKTINTLRRILPPEEYKALSGARQIMPSWMADAFVGAEGLRHD